MRKRLLCAIAVAAAVVALIFGVRTSQSQAQSGDVSVVVSAYQKAQIAQQSSPALAALRANGYAPMRIVYGSDRKMKAVEFRPACAASDFNCTQQSAPAAGVAWVWLGTQPVYAGPNVPISDASPQIIFDAQLTAGVTVCASPGWRLNADTFPAIIEPLYSAFRSGGRDVTVMDGKWICNRTN